MNNQTPDQIRQQTIPAKHNGLIYGFLGGLVGAVMFFGGWALFHQEQVMSYPRYCAHAIKASAGTFSLFGLAKRQKGMNGEELSYELMRYGNVDHRYDAEIIRHGRYPRGVNPRVWVFENGNVEPIYSDAAAMVFKWPTSLTLLTILGCGIWGMVLDTRYRASIIAGLPFDGSIVATVSDYNKEVKGSGMRYAVKAWKDR